jgi:hypothetical protein
VQTPLVNSKEALLLMAVSKANMGEKNPEAYAQGAISARAARAHVAEQLGHLIESADLTGSHPFVARRVKRYADAVKEGDLLVIRGALMELGAAVGATVAAIDLSLPQGQQTA